MKQTFSDIRQELQDRLALLNHDLIRREYSFKEITGKVRVAIGVRRSGKTFLMYEKILKLLNAGIEFNRILYINLEDDRLQPKTISLLRDLIDYFYQSTPQNHNQLVYLFFDEIQEIEGWPALIRRLLDTRQCEIYLTGSSAKLLSREIATSMRGRSLATEVWPFSFNEYLTAKNITLSTFNTSQKSKDTLLQHLQHYLLTGGFPEIVMHPSPEAISILQEYVDITIFRDIVERHNIKNIQLIRYLVRTMLLNIGSLFSINKLYNDLKSQGHQLGKTTLYDYLAFIDDCYLAFTIPMYSDSFRKTQVNPRKIYACDTGMATAYQYGYSNNLGHLFENFIYLELRKTYKEIYYYKTQDGYEIDFVAIAPGEKRNLYQVAWDVSHDETMQREIRALETAKIELSLEGELITPQRVIENLVAKGRII